MTSRQRTVWTFLITTVALFMVVLDNLVVSTAIPVIRVDLGASVEQLEWTVNAYTLTFAVFLLTGAALGDRFGRKRLLMIGLGIFTAAASLSRNPAASSAEWLIAARAVQGIGGAIVTPLTLTILSAAVPASRRGAALGVWSGVAGLAVAMGPLVGGAVVDGISWQWIFWLNVPIGLVLLPLATRLQESYGTDKALDLPGLALSGAGLKPMLHGSVHRMTRIYEQFGQSFCDYERYNANNVAGKVLICPPSTNRSRMLDKIPHKRIAMISGWAVEPNAVYRYQVDAAFPLTDHADYPDLLRYVDLVNPKRVLTVHGFASAFARDLRQVRPGVVGARCENLPEAARLDPVAATRRRELG